MRPRSSSIASPYGAIAVGVFSFTEAAGIFAAIVAGEILWGIGVGWLMLRLRRWVKDPLIEIVLSVLTPFLAFWPPVHLGGSGVLATVTAGLYVSWNGPRLINPGPACRASSSGSSSSTCSKAWCFSSRACRRAPFSAASATIRCRNWRSPPWLSPRAVIVARFVWIFPTAYLPRWLVPPIRRRDPSPPWQWPFVLAFTGVRGIVSLAAALAIPFLTATGAPFSGSRSDPVSDVFRDPRDSRRSGSPAAVGHPQARARACGTQGARGQQSRGVESARRSGAGRERAARSACSRGAISRQK